VRAERAGALPRTGNLNKSLRPVVTLPQGRFQGRAGDGYNAFSGIPYAEPPVGERRWRPPEPRKRGVPFSIDATRFGPIAPQAVESKDHAAQMSEDCLNLNVWAPQGASLAPVMVWIHGGGFCQGANRVRGSVFAKAGVVLVAPNYRLGLLGFMAHPSLPDQSANFGLLDLVVALRWVHDNIAEFGGDPNNVTVFGVSAGGQAVNLLMTMSTAAGLFSQAIAQSGYGTWPLLRASPTLDDPQDTLGDLAHAAEQAAEQTLHRAGVRGLSQKALLALPPAEIVSGQRGFQRPIVDGSVVIEEPGICFARGVVHKVPYIAGANSFDGSVMPSYQIDPESYQAYWQTLAANWRDAYRSDEQQALQRLFGDDRYLFSSWKLTNLIAASGTSAFRYYLDIPAADPLHWGTPHGFDGFLLFDAEALYPDSNFAGWGQSLIRAWTAFAKTGRPSSLQGVGDWLAVDVDPSWHRLGAASGTSEAELTARMTLLDLRYQNRIRSGASAV